MKVKTGDNVLIITGKDKGKTGKVLKILKKKNKDQDRVVVEKVNIRTRHIRKTVNGPGQKVQYEAPLHISNVAVICPKCNKARRISYIVPKDGKKYRVCKKCETVLDINPDKKK